MVFLGQNVALFKKKKTWKKTVSQFQSENNASMTIQKSMNYPNDKIIPRKQFLNRSFFFVDHGCQSKDHMIKEIPKIEQNNISPDVAMEIELSVSKCD